MAQTFQERSIFDLLELQLFLLQIINILNVFAFLQFISRVIDWYSLFKVYLLNYWHILISKGTCGFIYNTLLVRIQYCYQLKYFTDLTYM